jgi:transcriptional regulator with XRE-family HTH domain
MNINSYSIIDKRKQLGWTIKALAEKTNINYSTILRIEQGVIAGMDDYIFLIEATLNKALDLPFKKWSYKYDRCEKCGTTQTKHVSRGLCKNCYDRDIEKRHKDENRIRKHGESSSILTKEYLINNYTYQKKSLSDIAKDANCSRQYVYKKVLLHNLE